MAFHIVIATPDVILGKEYETALRKEGLAVVTVKGGVECVELLRSQAPDLLILDTDLLWGGADGVVALLADDMSLPPVQILLITPRLNRTVHHELSRFSIDEFQTKPLTGRGLVQRVRALTRSNADRGESTG